MLVLVDFSLYSCCQYFCLQYHVLFFGIVTSIVSGSKQNESVIFKMSIRNIDIFSCSTINFKSNQIPMLNPSWFLAEVSPINRGNSSSTYYKTYVIIQLWHWYIIYGKFDYLCVLRVCFIYLVISYHTPYYETYFFFIMNI